jgi:hypothetical protein
MNQDALNAILSQLFNTLVTAVAAEAVKQVEAKIDQLNMLDKDVIREICLEVVEASDMDDKISDYMCNSFEISDYESEIKELVNVRDELEDMLPDAVHECVQNLRFTVEVETR